MRKTKFLEIAEKPSLRAPTRPEQSRGKGRTNLFLILMTILLATSLAFAEEIKLTTIVPSQTVLRPRKSAIGETYSNPTVVPDSSIPASSLLVEGKVGIGTTSPIAKLHIYGNGTMPNSLGLDVSASRIVLENSNNSNKWFLNTWFQPTMDRFSIGKESGEDYLFIESDGNVGNVGIGMAPTDKLSIRGLDEPINFHMGNHQYIVSNARYPSPSGPWMYSTDGTAFGIQFVHDDYMGLVAAVVGTKDSTITWIKGLVVNKDGNVGIGGMTNPTYKLQLSTDSAGKPLSSAWSIVSDRRLKKDITPFEDGLNVLLQIRPVRYKLNGKAGTPLDAEGISVIGQDIQQIAPYTIKTYKAKLNPTDEKETELLDFDSSPLTFVMINAIKEQQREIESLKKEVAEIKFLLKK